MESETTQREPVAGARRALIAFGGREGELFGIFIVNFILAILTLGIYRFWAKTRVRRYLWAHAGFEGDRLEYTGTGKELILGFLIIVIVVLVPLFTAVAILRLALQASAPEFILVADLAQAGILIFLLPVAVYRARRYRLTRTQWRGVRAGQTGSALAYGLKSVLLYLLVVFTFGLAWPYCSTRLTAHKLNNTWLGDRRVAFDGRARPLYRRFLAVYSVYVLAFLSIPVVAGGVLQVSPDQPMSDEVGAVLVLYALLLLLLMRIPWNWYRAAEYRYFASRAQLEGLRFDADISGGALASLHIGNTLITIVTFGLGLPLVYLRNMRFGAARLGVSGEMDFASVVQSAQARPRMGEGLAEAFDIGGAYDILGI